MSLRNTLELGRPDTLTISILDNKRTVYLSSSDPNVLRVKITKPNIVGIYLYTVFVSVVFCARVSVQYVVVTVVRVIWAGGGLSGWSWPTPVGWNVTRMASGLTRALLGWFGVFFLSYILFGLVEGRRADPNLH